MSRILIVEDDRKIAQLEMIIWRVTDMRQKSLKTGKRHFPN